MVHRRIEMQVEKNHLSKLPEMISWIKKTENNLQYAWRNQ